MLHAKTSQKLSKFWRTFLVCETAAGDGLRGPIGGSKFRAGRKGVVANGLESKRFAGEDFGLRLDVILEINHEVVGIRAREGKNIGVLAINLNASSGHVNGPHAEGGDGNNGDDREHEGENQPLVLPQNQQVVVEVGFPGRESKGRNTGTAPPRLPADFAEAPVADSLL